MVLRDIEKALIQVLLARHLVEEEELLSIVERLKVDFPLNEAFDFETVFKRMNANLKRSGMEVRTVLKKQETNKDADDAQVQSQQQIEWVKYHGVANVEDDFVAKEFGSTFDEQEIKLFADIIPILLRDKVMSYADVENANHSKIAKSHVAAVLKKLHEEGWLGREQLRGYWELGIRSFLELKTHFESILVQVTPIEDEWDDEKVAEAQAAAKLELPTVIMY